MDDLGLDFLLKKWKNELSSDSEPKIWKNDC